MRHTSFFDEIVDRRHLIGSLMNSLGEIEEHILSKMLVKKRLVMNDIQMVIDEFLLDRPVIALNNAVDLRARGIDNTDEGYLLFAASCQIPRDSLSHCLSASL